MTHLAVVFIGIASVLAAQTALVRVHIPSATHAGLLQSLEVDICDHHLDGESAQVLLRDPRKLSELSAAGFAVELLTPDLEAYYASRLSSERGDSSAPPIGQGSIGGYHTLTEMVACLDAVAAQYPQIVAPKVSLGTSVEGRPIWMWKISDNVQTDEAEPEIIIDALHHAREPVTMIAAMYFIEQLAAGYGTDPVMTRLIDTREIFVVPCVNPDGYAFNHVTNPQGGGLWRKNRRPNGDGTFGVDLNRNYSFAFGFDNVGSSPITDSETYRGPAPFSEPETLALKTFAESRNLNLCFTLHSFGGHLFMPQSYIQNAYPATSVRPQYDSILADMSRLPPAYTVGTTWTTLLFFNTANGSTIDWWYGSLYGGLQAFAFEAELGSSADGFWPATNRIVPICDDAMHYFLHLCRVAGPDLRIDDLDISEPGGLIPEVWEPGETLHVRGTIHNRGTVAEQVSIDIPPCSPSLVTPSTPLSLGTLASLTSLTQTSNPLTLQLTSTAPVGLPLSFNVVATGAQSVDASRNVLGAVGLTPVTLIDDTCEVVGNWTLGDPSDTATAGLWTQDDPNGTMLGSTPANPEDDHTPSPGVGCFFTGQGAVGGSAGAADVDGGFTTLLSPIFDLSHLQHPTLHYARWFMTAGGDRLTIDLSNDGGFTWVNLETLAASHAAWIKLSVQMESYLPRTSRMVVRFRAADLGDPSVCEAAIDDLRITGLSPSVDLATSGTAAPGTTLNIDVNATLWPGAPFIVGSAFSALTGIATPQGTVPVDWDPLLVLSQTTPSVFSNFLGILDGLGAASAAIILPNDPGLSGLRFITSAVVVAPTGVLGIAGGTWITLP